MELVMHNDAKLTWGRIVKQFQHIDSFWTPSPPPPPPLEKIPGSAP